MSLKKAGAEENALIKLLREVAIDIGVAHHSYIVGGAVRDIALDIDPKDVDVVVETQNGKSAVTLAQALSHRLGLGSVHADQYGVVHVGPVRDDFWYDGVNLKGQKIEVVTARKEKYEKDKNKDFKPKSVEPGTIQDDILRRDFTFNTLLMRLLDLAEGPDKRVILDLTGLGLSDLENKILRTPLNPAETFDEDPSRMLRAIRMVIKYGMKFDPPVARAIREKASELQRVPEELIKQELEKIIKLKGFKASIMLLKGLGLLRYIVPEINDLKGLKTAIDVADSIDSDVVNRLAALFSVMDTQTAKVIFKEQLEFWENNKLDAETIGSILRRIKFPNEIIKRVVRILNNTSKLVGTPELSDKEVRRLIITFGDSLEATLEIVHSINLNGAIEYVKTINKNYIPELRERLKTMSEGEGEIMLQRIKNPPFDGNSIMTLLGLERGGPIVKKALDIQLEILLENPYADKELIEKTVIETLKK